ncbi:hypothetical protein EBL85_16340 [Marichromatium sp. AB32]|nr:hypothetical protein EBL85_16340 [Marichromatium sp. AB32]
MSQFSLPEHLLSELEYLVQLHRSCGAPNRIGSVDELLEYLVQCVADGSRRPGSWERDVLCQMGLVADCDEHHVYRDRYGSPSDIEPLTVDDGTK